MFARGNNRIVLTVSLSIFLPGMCAALSQKTGNDRLPKGRRWHSSSCICPAVGFIILPPLIQCYSIYIVNAGNARRAIQLLISALHCISSEGKAFVCRDRMGCNFIRHRMGRPVSIFAGECGLLPLGTACEKDTTQAHTVASKTHFSICFPGQFVSLSLALIFWSIPSSGAYR